MSEITEITKDGVVKKLDTNTSSAIRKTQIITKVSDVVRELVDNSVDAESSTIQVFLEDFGLVKIEVRDTGCGIAQSDFLLAFSGGHTSKLKDIQHLSSYKQYGFRGEALASICSIANVTVSTKTYEESQGRKYVLNKDGQIISESKVAVGTGTSITVKDLFANFPVRKKFIGGNKQKLADLKELERFLKAMAIANPKIHLSFYHDGNLSWTKPSVCSVDQALITVLGVVTAKKLSKCGPAYIHNENDIVHGKKGTMELFIPKKPVDYRTLSYTDRKVAMFIFVNRRRVDIREVEKMIQRYAASVSEKPAPADNHRFPVSVLLINVPPKEADFNRDMDKSKVFLTDKDEILARLEEMLQKFYEVDLCNSKASNEISSCQTSSISQYNSLTKNNMICNENSSNTNITSEDSLQFAAKPVLTAVGTVKTLPTREKTILAFLENIPTASETNFSLSPMKNPPQPLTSPCKTFQSSTLREASKPSISLSLSSLQTTGNDRCPVSEKENGKSIENFNAPSPNICPSKSATVSNFDVNFNLDFLEDTQPPEKKSRFDEIEKDKWIEGRLEDKFGGIIENVAIVRGPLTSDRISKSADSISVGKTNISLNSEKASIFGAQRTNSDRIQAKEHVRNSASFSSKKPNGLSSLYQSSQRGRQVTLDSFRNWKTPGKSIAGGQKMLSQQKPETMDKNHNRKTAADVLNGSSKNCTETLGSTSFTTPNPTPEETPIGVIPPSVKDYLAKRLQTSDIVSGVQQKTIHSSQFFSTSETSQRRSEFRKVLPKIIGLLPGTLLYVAKIDGFLGVFNPQNLLEMFPEIKNKHAEALGLTTYENMTEDLISSLLIDFVSECSLKSETGQKIFYVLSDLDVLEFAPRVSSTQYSI